MQQSFAAPAIQGQRNRIYHWSLMQTEKSQSKGNRIMPEMRFTVFLALSVDQRVRISQAAFEAHVWYWLFFLPMPLRNIIYHLSLCPATKSGGVLCYTLRTFECLSVRQRLIIHVRSITLIPFEIISRSLAQI